MRTANLIINFLSALYDASDLRNFSDSDLAALIKEHTKTDTVEDNAALAVLHLETFCRKHSKATFCTTGSTFTIQTYKVTALNRPAEPA